MTFFFFVLFCFAEALPAKAYVVYDAADKYGRFHSSYQFILESLATFADISEEDLHKTVLNFESKLYEMH